MERNLSWLIIETRIPCAAPVCGIPCGALSPAMAYVPWQYWDQTYDLEKALQCGTIFPELNKPFSGKRGGCR